MGDVRPWLYRLGFGQVSVLSKILSNLKDDLANANDSQCYAISHSVHNISASQAWEPRSDLLTNCRSSPVIRS